MATVVIQIAQSNGTFTAPPSLQRVTRDDYVNWVAGSGVSSFRVKFKKRTPFGDDAFDIDDNSPHKATRTGNYSYAVHVTGTDGKPWAVGGCPELDVK